MGTDTLRQEVTGVEVNMTAVGHLDKTNWLGEPIPATRVQWRAHVGARGLVVSVTAFADNHQNQTWVDARYFVAHGLNTATPPSWVPDAPSWFWAAVDGMASL